MDIEQLIIKQHMVAQTSAIIIYAYHDYSKKEKKKEVKNRDDRVCTVIPFYCI